MKVVFIVLGVFILIAVGVLTFSYMSTSGIESYKYTVEKEYDSFEIRSYEPSLFTSVRLSTSNYEEASGQGFSTLAGYIFGGNEKEEKIAMTSPVNMTLGDSMEVSFMVPEKYKKEDLPKPNQEGIKFKEEPKKRVAAITFGGWANNKKIEEYKKKLIDALEKEGINYSDKFSFMGYNPPFDVINRRNEVVVELK